MVDKDYAEINALSSIFPESHILLCWYHVLQAVQRWLSKTESGVHGPSNLNIRKDIISFFCKLKACKTEAEFETTAKKFKKMFRRHPAVCQYFTRHWEEIGHMWSDYGRCFEHLNTDTNNVIERFFYRLKYQFLGGVRNRRIDDLIHVLLEKAEDYFTIMRDLQYAGRVKNKFSHPPSLPTEATAECVNDSLAPIPLHSAVSLPTLNLIFWHWHDLIYCPHSHLIYQQHRHLIFLPLHYLIFWTLIAPVLSLFSNSIYNFSHL
ncbi:uncharacterized protein LOC134067101 [Sardina pilchardus]|uniref:uncharacterized protein LOC134067101 n=1 Tax=Sardina pilchardus TaxID=27697 RepID=UPI002E14A5A1